jgi:MFS family permease
MKRYCNGNDPRSVIFVSNSDKRCGTTFNFAHPPKWRWVLLGIILVLSALALFMVENRAVRIGWNIAMLLLFMTWPRLLRSMAERQQSLHPGPMGPRTPDGLYAAAEMFSVEGERRKFFYIMLIILAVLFASVLAVGIYGGMLWSRAALFAAFLSVMGMAMFMIPFGFLGLVGGFYSVVKKKDALLLPLGIALLAVAVLTFSAVADFCSSRTMYVTQPSGEQTAFRVPVADDKRSHSGDGWKAYRGYHDGKAYLLIESGTGGTSIIHVGTKGPVSFFSMPMEGDDITVFNMHSKRVFHIKRDDDGVWSMKGDNSAWVQ